MSFKLRILTFHHIPNNGAFLFAHALGSQLLTRFPGFDVKIIDYKTPRLALYEYLKRFKLFPNEPLFYYKRYQRWEKLLAQMSLDKNFHRFSGERKVQQYYSTHADALLVGMDVWSIIDRTPRPLFPNIYWLPEKIKIPKLAYGISAYNSDPSLIKARARQITAYLNDFVVIGSRDRFTHELVMQHRTRTDGLVERVPDPVLLHSFPKTGISELAASLGVDLDRPLLGLLLFGNNKLSEQICSHFRAKGYQVVALSMYNPYADINLGHILDPFQWVEFFGLIAFCVTDRFHGTVFCIKNQIPFISLENEKLPEAQSKLYDLLTDFNLTRCYQNLHSEHISDSQLLSQITDIDTDWEKSLRPSIEPTLLEEHDHYKSFIDKMGALMGWDR
jgi:hypothetical protein